MPREAKIGATRNSYVYRLRLPGDLRAQWDEHCAGMKEKPADILRALMRYMIRDQMPKEVRSWLAKQVDTVTAEEVKERVQVQIRLTKSEHQAITERAEAEGCSVQRWIIHSARASLTHAPQYTHAAATRLDESCEQLRRVGVNLNQLVKAANQGRSVTIADAQIQKLSQHINSHIEKVRDFEDASLERWGVEKHG